MGNHLSRFIEEKGNWYLSGGVANVTVSYLTDKIMNGLTSLFNKSRALQLIDYIDGGKLNNNEIIKVLVDLSFCLYFERIGHAQYKVSQSPVSCLFSGIKFKLQSKSFFEGCVEPIYQRYRIATKEINHALIYIISKMVERNIISEDEALDFDRRFLKPTHVDYEEMSFSGVFNDLSFIDILRKFDKVQINEYFRQKYKDIIGMKDPCNSDDYKMYIRHLHRDNVQEGNRYFYESEDVSEDI